MSLIHVNFILTTRESLGSEDYVGCLDKSRAACRHFRGALDGGRTVINQQDVDWRKR